MRIMRLNCNYPTYLNKFYQRDPNLKNEPYQVQYSTLMEDCYAQADFWSQALSKIGYEGWEPVGNAEPQQKAWAKEHGIHYEFDSWLTDILAAQVKSFKPDIIFVSDYHTYKKFFLDHLREICPSIRLILGWCGAPYFDSSVFCSYNVVLSNIVSLVKNFRERGHRSELIRHAFAPKILDKIEQGTEEIIPFSFCGSIFKAEHFHNDREKILRYLSINSEIHIWSDHNAPPIKKYRKLDNIIKFHDNIRKLLRSIGLYSHAKYVPLLRGIIDIRNDPDISKFISIEIVEKCNPGLYGLEMYQKLKNSKVTFNNHIDISKIHANNMRLYEATGVGTCLLTDWKKDLHDLFEPDYEVVSYCNAEEALEKLKYLFENEAVRKQIALAGQNRTLRDHTFDIRAEELDRIIRKII